jgi:predicted GNAT family acetyltransferase
MRGCGGLYIFLNFIRQANKMNYDEQKLIVNEASHRLELWIGESMAFIDYKILQDKLFLIHTEVPPALEGKGAGTAIVQKAFQYAKYNHLLVVPICPFVQVYLKRHSQWNDIVAPDADRYSHKP